MIICFSFDDGRADFYNTSQILYKHGLKGTFHITTGFIDGSFTTCCFGKDRSPLTITQLQDMTKCGMEIASHGDRHITNSNDFKQSLIKIRKWIKTNGKIGFSIPNSKIQEGVLHNFVCQNATDLLYVRGGRSKNCYSLLPKAAYFFYHHICKLQFIYNYFNKNNLNFTVDKWNLNSVVVTNDIKLSNVVKFIKKYARYDCVVVLMFHSIVQKPNDRWEWKESNFSKLCEHISELIKEGKIVCKRIDELFKTK